MAEEKKMALDHLIKDVRFMDFESEPEWIWQDDAACQWMPATMWEVAQRGDLIAMDLGAIEIKDLNRTNLTAAEAICKSCPVRQDCESSATTGDLMYTMRGGIWPTKWEASEPQKKSDLATKMDLVGNEKRAALALVQFEKDSAALATRQCFRGHVGVFGYGGGRVHCLSCKDEGISLDVQPHYPWCTKGHVEWNSGTPRRCRACERMKNRKKKAARKAAEAGKLES